MSKNLVVQRLISAVERNAHETGHMIVSGAKLGYARMVTETAIRKFIHEKGVDDLQMTYLDAIDVDGWVEQLVFPNDVAMVVDLVYTAFDAWWEAGNPVRVK